MDKLSCSFFGIPYTESIPPEFILVDELKEYMLKDNIENYSDAYQSFNGERYVNKNMLKTYMKN